jgi:uncharacterized protein YicC (UPF0701 family)
MAVSSVNEIESQFARLPTDSQLSLLERLVHQLRRNFGATQESWEAELSAMAADPQIQEELRRIDSEFGAAEADGLGKS